MMLMWRCCKSEIALPEIRWRLGLGDRKSWEGWGGFRRKILGSERDQREKGRAGISNVKRIWEGNPHPVLSPPLLLIFMATMSGFFFFFFPNTSKCFSETNSTDSDTVYLEVASDPTPVLWDCPPAPFQILLTSPSCHPCIWLNG